MNITLGKEFERRISEKVADGLYTSAVEVEVTILQNHRACTGKVSALTNYSYSPYSYNFRQDIVRGRW